MVPLKVLVVGYNVRGVVESLKNLNHEIYCVTYWKDLDVVDKTVKTIKIPWFQLEDIKTGIKRCLQELRKLKETEEIDFCLVTSGFDDFPFFWKEISKIFPLKGNGADSVRNVRNWRKFFSFLEERGINFPETEIVKGYDEVLNILNEMKPPLVLKAPFGSGGKGKKLILTEDDIPAVKGEVLVQKYVEGVDASASFLSNREEAFLVSINRQLIGEKWLNSPGDFTFCGNISPYKVKPETKKQIEVIVDALTNEFSLVGSNGIDFILKKGIPYLVEVNPRFQGSIGCIERAYEINLTQLHLQACNGELPKKKFKAKKFSGRGVVFSPRKGKVPNLKLYSFVKDLSPPNTEVKKGEPVCSVVDTHKNYLKVFQNLKRKAKRITEAI